MCQIKVSEVCCDIRVRLNRRTENALQVAIMRKEHFIIECDSPSARDALMAELKDCIEFAASRKHSVIFREASGVTSSQCLRHRRSLPHQCLPSTPLLWVKDYHRIPQDRHLSAIHLSHQTTVTSPHPRATVTVYHQFRHLRSRRSTRTEPTTFRGGWGT